MAMGGRKYVAPNNGYRYGVNGQEKDDDIAGAYNHYTALFWEYDTRIGRRWNTDPVVKAGFSDYVTFGNNPIRLIDPNGDDWYENLNYDSKNKDSKQYEWFEGSDEKDGYTRLGEYLVTPDKTNNSLTIRYQNDWSSTVNLNTDMGKRFSMVALEGGFIKASEGRGVKVKEGIERESLYGLAVIAASMNNRLQAIFEDKKLAEYWGDGSSFESLFRTDQYNAAAIPNWSTAVTNKFFDQWSGWYGKGATMQYLADVYTASMGDPVAVLYFGFNMGDAHRIFAYAHNNPKPSSQIREGYMLKGYDKTKTLINVVSTADWVKRSEPTYMTKEFPHLTEQRKQFVEEILKRKTHW